MKLCRVSEGANRVGYSVPSYYRIASEGLLPPPIKLGKNRSALIASELEAVIAARVRGESDDEVRALVKKLVNNRKYATSGYQNNTTEHKTSRTAGC